MVVGSRFSSYLKSQRDLLQLASHAIELLNVSAAQLTISILARENLAVARCCRGVVDICL